MWTKFKRSMALCVILSAVLIVSLSGAKVSYSQAVGDQSTKSTAEKELPKTVLEDLARLDAEFEKRLQRLKDAGGASFEDAQAHFKAVVDAITEAASKFDATGKLSVELGLMMANIQNQKKQLEADANIDPNVKGRLADEMTRELDRLKQLSIRIEDLYKNLNQLALDYQIRERELIYAHRFYVARNAIQSIENLVKQYEGWLGEMRKRLDAHKPGS